MNTLKLLKIVKIMLDMPNGIIFRAGKGQVFPTCEPDRVTAEALKRRNNGFSLRDLTLQRKSIGSLSLIKIFKETPVNLKVAIFKLITGTGLYLAYKSIKMSQRVIRLNDKTI
jgi:hypothetical protein